MTGLSFLHSTAIVRLASDDYRSTRGVLFYPYNRNIRILRIELSTLPVGKKHKQQGPPRQKQHKYFLPPTVLLYDDATKLHRDRHSRKVPMYMPDKPYPSKAIDRLNRQRQNEPFDPLRVSRSQGASFHAIDDNTAHNRIVDKNRP